MNTTPISGMQELLPASQAIFDNLKSELAAVYHRHGYLSIETPTIDRAEILLAKAGGDTEKQIYKVIKTAETEGDADQALRFDHTVPLARYVVEHESVLTFPFKVTQIGRNFRGERAQKGRFREFYQCDIDVVGRGTLPLVYDADVISTIIDAFKSIKLPPVLARISNRKIWTGLFEALNLEEYASEILSIVDHAEKMPAGEAEKAIEGLGIPADNVVKITTLMQIHGSAGEIEPRFAELGIDSTTFRNGVSELLQLLRLLESQSLDSFVTADLLIVRGLDYYTGTVFEFILPEHKAIGSICGGGRYDNLASHFTDQSLPGIGASIGLTRLFYILNEEGLLSEAASAPIDIMLMPLSEAQYGYCFELAAKLRSEGNSVDIDFSDKKLGERFNRNSKIAKQAIVIGEDEVESGQYRVKSLS